MIKTPSRKLQKYNRTQIFVSLFGLTFALLIGLFLFQFLGLTVAVLLSDFDLGKLFEIVQGKYNLYADTRHILLIIQGFITLGMFLILPCIYVRYFDHTFRYEKDISFVNRLSLLLILLTVFLIFTTIPINSLLMYWNEQFAFPDFLSDLERLLLEKERNMKELTLFITNAQSVSEFILTMLVIAVIPAVAEEFFFRGIVQHKLESIFGNIHLSIWITGFLFSAFHFQFYGLIPRMFLGVLFGYLYYWSNSLWLPILGHFINNGYTLSVLYFFRDDFQSSFVAKTSMPNIYLVLGATLLTIGMLYLFRSFSWDNKNKSHE